MTAKPLYYLATSYRLHPGGLDDAYAMACHEAAILTRAGVPVFSPIVHGHGLSVHGGIDPVDNDIWVAINENFIGACVAGLIVLKSPNWEASRGIAKEIEDFESRGYRAIYMTPGIVPLELA